MCLDGSVCAFITHAVTSLTMTALVHSRDNIGAVVLIVVGRVIWKCGYTYESDVYSLCVCTCVCACTCIFDKTRVDINYIGKRVTNRMQAKCHNIHAY